MGPALPTERDPIDPTGTSQSNRRAVNKWAIGAARAGAHRAGDTSEDIQRIATRAGDGEIT